LVNETIKTAGGKPIAFLTTPSTFPLVIILSDLWKEMGFSAIIFLAALIAIDPHMYEAAAERTPTGRTCATDPTWRWPSR
jgi:putative aldouronate transport system permease protein